MQRLEAFAQAAQEGEVVGAAAGDEEFGRFGERGALAEVRPDEAAVGVEDAVCGEGGGGGDDVALFGAFAPGSER